MKDFVSVGVLRPQDGSRGGQPHSSRSSSTCPNDPITALNKHKKKLFETSGGGDPRGGEEDAEEGRVGLEGDPQDLCN